jgi:membrane associated rhomboid family serine protease
MHLDAARTELDAIDAEEADARRAALAPPPEHVRWHSKYAPLGGALFALALIGFYMVTGPSAARSIWFRAGSSDAPLVLGGEWYRAVTGLTLHADSNHVLSNVALGAVVVTMVMRRTGVGLGAALVVFAGALGNVVNAWAYGLHHNSIGFSTAVFGAIGLLGGLTYVGAVRDSATLRGRPAWIAIAGAMGLLAMLGASERTDMLAHLFGTFAGLAIGVGVGAARLHPKAWPWQVVIGTATLTFVIGCWAAALHAA